MLSDFLTCPRKFYLRHVRGWDSEAPNIAALWGTCFHASADVIWAFASGDPSLSNKELVEAGIQAFMERWRAEGLAEGEALLSAEALYRHRTPALAERVIRAYVERYAGELRRTRLIHTERPFLVLVGMSEEHGPLLMGGKLDKTTEREGPDGTPVRRIVDHKTTSMGGPNGFYPSWLESFNPNAQIDTYSFAGASLLGEERFDAVLIDAVLVNERHTHFTRIVQYRGPDEIAVWRAEREALLSDLLSRESESARAPRPELWPRNTEACQGKYGRCPMLGICANEPWPGPDESPEPSAGYTFRPWEPLAEIGLFRFGGGASSAPAPYEQEQSDE